MTKQTITAAQAIKNAESINFDNEYVKCDINKSIENSSKFGRRKIGRKYLKTSVQCVNFNSIIASVKEQGFKAKIVDSKDSIYVEVIW